jgi:hypothetical protein
MAHFYRARHLKNLVGGIFARPELCFLYLAMLLIPMLGGCGGIRFSEVAPEAKDFHPQSIALISLDVGGYEDAREVVDGIIAGELARKNWFRAIVSAKKFQLLLQGSEDLRKAAVDYLAKLKMVNFSDPELSSRIGKIAGIDAFVLVSVDYWYYTKEGDKNIAKVGLGIRMINADTGALVWKAGHYLAADYVIMKPELSGMAGDVVKQMIMRMPH